MSLMSLAPEHRLMWSGRFADKEVERAFREAKFQPDISLCRLIITCIACMTLIYIPLDFYYFGFNFNAYRAFTYRVIILVVSAIIWVKLKHVKTEWGLVLSIGIWLIPLVTFNHAILLNMHTKTIGSAPVYAVSVMLGYFLPLPFWFRFSTGFFVSTTYLMVMSFRGWPDDGGIAIIPTTVGLITANTFGALTSIRLNWAVRERHVDRLALEKASAEIKTLEGLLPICAHCKKIKDEIGNWQAVEMYIANRTSAEFSHGICPTCLKTHYGLEINPPA